MVTKKAVTKKRATRKTGTNMVSVQEQMEADLANLDDRVQGAAGPQISTAGKMFKLPDGQMNGGPMEVVIVDFTNRYMYYENEYDPDSVSPPTCFAIGDTIRTLAPSDNSIEKQAESCDKCPMNQFGSAGKGKACKNQRRLAVVPPNDDGEAPIFMLNVSPMALKQFDAYVKRLKAQYKKPSWAVVTAVSFNEDVTFPMLEFEFVRENENAVVHVNRKAEARSMLEAEPDMTTSAEKPAASKRGRARAARR